MVKFWCRTELDEKLSRSEIVEFDGLFREKLFDEYLVQICYTLDIPTPIILKSHVKNLVAFNVTRFLRSDFIDTVDFDTLIIEYVLE